ncbi:MAG: DnaA ATPase domain-containing protein, partial [Candidatus Methylomirabilaceae bacterium]
MDNSSRGETIRSAGSTANAREIWGEALSAIQGRVTRQSFDNWFRPLTLESIEESRVNVLLPNRFFKEWFEDHYLSLLKSVLEDLMFTKADVSLRVQDPERQPAADTRPEAVARRPVRRYRNDSPFLNPKYTFENFVVGGSNQFVHAGCLAVGEQLSKAYNPLFIYGGVGLGKTHLLHAIGHLVMKR